MRAVSADDAQAAGALLRASYAALPAPGYGPGLLARTLASMTVANPARFTSGSFAAAKEPSGGRTLAGCGG